MIQGVWPRWLLWCCAGSRTTEAEPPAELLMGSLPQVLPSPQEHADGGTIEGDLVKSVFGH